MPPQTTYPSPILEKDGIRFFSDPGLQASMEKALASATTNSAVVELQANKTGYNAAIAARLGDKWSVVLGYQKDGWGNTYGAKVRFQW